MTEAAEASYDGAIDEFLGEAPGTDEKAPEPKKEQPGKAPAKTEDKAPAKAAPQQTEEPADDEGDDDATDAKPKDGPWRAELAQRGIDTPEVNQYMAEVVQPYITRLEQQGGEISQLFEGDAEAAGIAAGLLNELGDNPAKAIADLIHLLDVDDNEINEALGALLDGNEPQGQEGEQPAPQPEGEVDEENETPEQRWIRERMEEEQPEIARMLDHQVVLGLASNVARANSLLRLQTA